MEEIWCDVKGYEGLYQISNMGKVYSIKRHGTLGGIIKPSLNSDGYPCVNLSKGGNQTSFRIHRLVAEAFIPNPNNYSMINHKDESKNNNCVENLEWCNNSYNCNYGTRNKRLSKSLTGKPKSESHRKHISEANKGRVVSEEQRAKKRVPIIQLDLNGNFVKEYSSIKQALSDLGGKTNHISACCRGYRNIAYGYKWQYKSITK